MIVIMFTYPKPETRAGSAQHSRSHPRPHSLACCVSIKYLLLCLPLVSFAHGWRGWRGGKGSISRYLTAGGKENPQRSITIDIQQSCKCKFFITPSESFFFNFNY
jgi:hypothetical protein